MSTMKEMAVEYRLAAAKMRLQIQRKKESGAPTQDITTCNVMLQELRDTYRLLGSYYDAPRVSPNAAIGWYAPRNRGD